MKNNILPDDIISLVKNEGEGLDFGCVILKIFFRSGNPRWEISRSKSIVNDTSPKGIDAAYLKTTDDEGL
jgi:hypothetical protein